MCLCAVLYTLVMQIYFLYTFSLYTILNYTFYIRLYAYIQNSQRTFSVEFSSAVQLYSVLEYEVCSILECELNYRTTGSTTVLEYSVPVSHGMRLIPTATSLYHCTGYNCSSKNVTIVLLPGFPNIVVSTLIICHRTSTLYLYW